MSYFKFSKSSPLKMPLLSLACVCLCLPESAFAQAKPFLPGALGAGQNISNDFLPDGSGGVLEFEGDKFEFEESTEELEEQSRKNAFDAALQGLLPLRPEEIRELLEHFDRTQESVELPVYPAPKPEIAVETLSMDPGTKPKTIKVAYGYVTTLNLLDTTGRPWPIQDITWAGNFEVFEVAAGENKYTNVLRITPQSEFAYGNMSISMIDLPTPIIISLETNRDIVHYRYDAIVPKQGPFAQTPIIKSGLSLSAGDVDMTSILAGVVPPSAIKMRVSGIDGRTTAYRYSGLTYLRTPLTLLSPGWISSASSADGMHIYAMENAPFVLLSNDGAIIRAHLSDREDVFNE